MSYGTLQNDRSQRKALESLLNGTAESLASKQDSTLAALRSWTRVSAVRG